MQRRAGRHIQMEILAKTAGVNARLLRWPSRYARKRPACALTKYPGLESEVPLTGDQSSALMAPMQVIRLPRQERRPYTASRIRDCLGSRGNGRDSELRVGMCDEPGLIVHVVTPPIGRRATMTWTGCRAVGCAPSARRRYFRRQPRYPRYEAGRRLCVTALRQFCQETSLFTGHAGQPRTVNTDCYPPQS